LKNADQIKKLAVEIADDVQWGEQIEHSRLGSKELTDGITELNEDGRREKRKEDSIVAASSCHDALRKTIKGGIKKSKREELIRWYIRVFLNGLWSAI
jgi:hypothetical protein